MDIRCANKLHGVLHEDGLLHIKCNSRFCGADSGNTVIHRFRVNPETMEVTELPSMKFKDPGRGG